MKRPHGLALLLLGVVISSSGAAQTPAAMPGVAPAISSGPGSLTGAWINPAYRSTGTATARDRQVRASDGKVPPLLPAAAALLEKRIKEADEQDRIFANTLSQCLPGGIPAMLFGAGFYPIQIIESAGQIVMLFDEQNHFRLIRLNGQHQANPDPSYMGDSIAHWEGETLVVDTIGLNDRTTLDMVGTPHTEALHVIERYRRASRDKLDLAVTIEDRGTFSKPWEMKTTYTLAPATQSRAEYICENNRNVPDDNGHQTFGAAPLR